MILMNKIKLNKIILMKIFNLSLKSKFNKNKKITNKIKLKKIIKILKKTFVF